MMFEGEPYLIGCDGEAAGFFSLGASWDNGKMLRVFYMVPSMRSASAEIFHKLEKDFCIEAALVASNDAHFIALAFERMNAEKTYFDMQAFNFVYGAPPREAEYGLNCVTKVQPCEYESMNLLTEKQWEDSLEDENFKFYAIKWNDEILGYGSIGRMRYNEKNVDIGNYTLAQHRKKGVGRSLIINLGQIAQQGFLPVAGCWYGNTASINTLTSGGFIPENRIFYVRFR